MALRLEPRGSLAIRHHQEGQLSQEQEVPLEIVRCPVQQGNQVQWAPVIG